MNYAQLLENAINGLLEGDIPLKQVLNTADAEYDGYDDEDPNKFYNDEQAAAAHEDNMNWTNKTTYQWRLDQEASLKSPVKFHTVHKARTRLGSIAKEGLKPNPTMKSNFRGMEDNSFGRLFMTADEEDAKNWARRMHRGEIARKEKPAVLRATGVDTSKFHVDDEGPTQTDQFTKEPVSPDKLDIWHAKTGWTPLSAHAPELWKKLYPRHMDINSKPKGQMQLFPKELYNEAVMNIVNELLAETTFLQARSAGTLDKSHFQAMSAVRKEASRRFGQKIPVLSTDELHGFDGGSRATTTNVVLKNREGSTYNDVLNMVFPMTQHSPTEALSHKLRTEKPHVKINVGPEENQPDSVHMLGHELGHVIDPVQNTPDHASADSWGRYMIGGSEEGAFNPHEDLHGVKAVMKSEGRAWRVGKDLQRTAAPHTLGGWENRARESLRSYTGSFGK